MFYTIYKITNNLNGKFYIGKHQTKDLNDGYMGSGRLIRRAIQKYGKSNFTKEILHVFQTEEEMNAKEKELVVISEQSYNLCEGGKGGFGYINQNELWNYPKHAEIAKENRKIGTKNLQLLMQNSNWKQEWSANISNSLLIKTHQAGYIHHWVGRNHSLETKRKIGEANSIHQTGTKNSQFGTMWITDGITNRKIKKLDSIPDGWYKGRV